MEPRWLMARTTRRAHLDLGERSSQSLRVRAEHIIVTACRSLLAPDAPQVDETYEPLCSNCLRHLRAMKKSGRLGASDSFDERDRSA